jgi:GNAT superfamily N-acetyltransferase
MKIRSANISDAPIILDLILELAHFEKAPEQVISTESEIIEHFFGDAPKVFCEMIESDNQVAGFAIWFLNYSTWQGLHGIYLEDLFIKSEYRGRGFGKALLVHLAQKCLTNGYGRFQWWVLDWNNPAVEFYKSLGAVAMEEWTVYRVSGTALRNLADISLRS